jgi:hypothetical protein
MDSQLDELRTRQSFQHGEIMITAQLRYDDDTGTDDDGGESAAAASMVVVDFGS